MKKEEVVMEKPDTVLDRLFGLLMTQKADGSFLLGTELHNWLGTRAPKVKQESKQNPVIVTAVVVALLEKEAPNNQAEWKRAMDKAKAYLAKNGNPTGYHLI